jgi:hypothetical protein
MDQSRLQSEVDAMLRRGVIFSIVWLMGFGSLIAVVQAFKARKIIQQSNGKIRGSGKVVWCLVVGGLGLLFWGYVLVMVLMSALKS